MYLNATYLLVLAKKALIDSNRPTFPPRCTFNLNSNILNPSSFQILRKQRQYEALTYKQYEHISKDIVSIVKMCKDNDDSRRKYIVYMKKGTKSHYYKIHYVDLSLIAPYLLIDFLYKYMEITEYKPPYYEYKQYIHYYYYDINNNEQDY